MKNCFEWDNAKIPTLQINVHFLYPQQLHKSCAYAIATTTGFYPELQIEPIYPITSILPDNESSCSAATSRSSVRHTTFDRFQLNHNPRRTNLSVVCDTVVHHRTLLDQVPTSKYAPAQSSRGIKCRAIVNRFDEPEQWLLWWKMFDRILSIFIRTSSEPLWHQARSLARSANIMRNYCCTRFILACDLLTTQYR